jgi:hypothetical protein
MVSFCDGNAGVIFRICPWTKKDIAVKAVMAKALISTF